MAGKAQKSHGARSGLYGGCFYGVRPIHFFQTKQRIQFRSRSMRFLGFSNDENGAPRQEISKWSTVCSTFSRSGRSVVGSESLVKGDTSKKRPSPHLHKVPTRSNKVSPRTMQTPLVKHRRYKKYDASSKVCPSLIPWTSRQASSFKERGSQHCHNNISITLPNSKRLIILIW
jgi:hypothetical protein